MAKGGQLLRVRAKFLGNLRLTEVSVTAPVLFKYLDDFVCKRGLAFQKVIGFGSDGAGIITGLTNGVATQMTNKNPFCNAVHCIANRLNLVSSQAVDVPYLKILQKAFTEIFRYFHCSSSHSNALKAIQKVLELPEVKMKEVYEVRWLAFYNRECIR